MGFDLAYDLNQYYISFQRGFFYHLISLSLWTTIHILSGIYLSKCTTWIQDAATILHNKAKSRPNKKIKTYNEYLADAKWDLCIRFTAFTHALIVSTGTIYTVATSTSLLDTYEELYTAQPLHALICILSSGYFLYDFIVATVTLDIPFMCHGALAYLAYGPSAYPFCARYGAIFTGYEISTIFLNIRAICISIGKATGPLFEASQYLFFFTFLICRCVFGFWYSLGHVVPQLLGLLWDSPQPPHSYLAAGFNALSNTGLNLLNVMWGYSILKIALGSGKSKKKNIESVESKIDTKPVNIDAVQIKTKKSAKAD